MPLRPAHRWVLVGDLVNRGPESLRTLRLLAGMGERVRTVLGNHDLHLLAASHGVRAPSRSDTIADILAAPDRDDLLDWLRRQPLALMADGHLVVHAGVLPQWTAAQVLALSAEVETQLQGDDWPDFLRTMYGNEPARWDDALEGADRMRCIVNALTRLRFCTADGTMEFATKEGPGNAPEGYVPWFDVQQRRTADVPVVFGHWSTLGVVQRDRPDRAGQRLCLGREAQRNALARPLAGAGGLSAASGAGGMIFRVDGAGRGAASSR